MWSSTIQVVTILGTIAIVVYGCTTILNGLVDRQIRQQLRGELKSVLKSFFVKNGVENV